MFLHLAQIFDLFKPVADVTLEKFARIFQERFDVRFRMLTHEIVQ